MGRVWVYKIGKFEVASRRELARTLLGSVFLLVASRGPTGYHWQRRWANFARRYLRLSEDVEGIDKVDPNTSYLVAPLHEGFADALLLSHLPLRLRFVARDELFTWPTLGPFLRRTNQIRIAPEGRVVGYRQLIQDIETAASRSESVVMFPQGSILGIEAGFHRGPFHIADRLNLSLLPVVITGTHRVWEHPFSDRLRYGQSVSMRVLDPLPIGTAEQLMGEVQRRMKEVALGDTCASPRRFDPDSDGYWPGYAYEIDPAFADIAEKVATFRAHDGHPVA